MVHVRGASRRLQGRLLDLSRPLLVGGVLLLLLGFADLVVPARAHLFGYSRVFAPYLALAFVALLFVAMLVRGRMGRRLVLVAVAGLALWPLRVLPSLPGDAVAADPSAPRVRVASWNLYLDHVPADVLIEALLARAPGVVGLQELTTTRARMIVDDPRLTEAFPTQVLYPADDWSGMGLLSSWPLEAPAGHADMPPLVDVTVWPAGAVTPIRIIVAHPPPPLMRLGLLGPSYDPTLRDAAVIALRDRANAAIDAGESVVILGDLNLTDREVIHGELIVGLTDGHRVAGAGLGNTWRPPVGDGLPFGLLRIDMVLTGPGVVPVRVRPDCTPRHYDHCILDATLALPVSGTAARPGT